MSHVAKLSIAVALALVAAMLNAMWLNAEKKPPMFVAARSDLKADVPITDEMLAPVPVPGSSETLRSTLIPYGNRAILLGVKTPRKYDRGDVFFQRDIKAPLEMAKFDVIGPFKLISVGARFKEPATDSSSGQDAGGDNITIAMDANFEEKSRKLLAILDASKSIVRGGKTIKIIAIQVVPKEQSGSMPALDPKNVVYQTISLSGMESVPRVLLEGDWIRFVVPAPEPL